MMWDPVDETLSRVRVAEIGAGPREERAPRRRQDTVFRCARHAVSATGIIGPVGPARGAGAPRDRFLLEVQEKMPNNDENAAVETVESDVEVETVESDTEAEAVETQIDEIGDGALAETTIGQLMDAIGALDARISDIMKEIADLKSVRIESGAEYVDTDEDGIEEAYDDPDPRSIDELDLTL